MTNRAALEELAARVEAHWFHESGLQTPEEWQLETAIWRFAGEPGHSRWYWEEARSVWWYGHPDHDNDWDKQQPSYLRSIDAAMTLVPGSLNYPDHKTFVLDCATQTTVHAQPVAHVWNEQGKHTGKGRTPALALTAACLRSIASTPEQEKRSDGE